MSDGNAARRTFAETEARLADCLAQHRPERLGDLERRPDVEPADLRPAAVLLLLERVLGYNVILTKRTDTVEHHKGEISLAGGMAEAGDRHATDTALREAHEELGIDPARVTVLGTIDRLITDVHE